MTIPNGENDWTEWNGGECPVPGQRVDVRFRFGDTWTNKLADNLAANNPGECCWRHDAGASDIVAYRVISS